MNISPSKLLPKYDIKKYGLWEVIWLIQNLECGNFTKHMTSVREELVHFVGHVTSSRQDLLANRTPMIRTVL